MIHLHLPKIGSFSQYCLEIFCKSVIMPPKSSSLLAVLGTYLPYQKLHACTRQQYTSNQENKKIEEKYLGSKEKGNGTQYLLSSTILHQKFRNLKVNFGFYLVYILYTCNLGQFCLSIISMQHFRLLKLFHTEEKSRIYFICFIFAFYHFSAAIKRLVFLHLYMEYWFLSVS